MPILSDKNQACCLCSEVIKEAEVMSPLMAEEPATPNQKYQLVYAHPGCIREEHTSRIPVCKHWQTKGVCVYQSSCQFRHPPEEAGSLAKTRGRHGTWKRRRVYNEGRASCVRRWMLNVLGRDYLLEGGCLDIAGGKGEFSFEIINLNGVMSTVFDPRPLDLYRYKRKLEFGFYHRNDVLGCYNHLPAPLKGEAPCLPNHIRGFFEMFESGALNTGQEVEVERENEDKGKESFTYPLILRGAESFEAGLDIGQSIAWSTKGLIHEDEDDSICTGVGSKPADREVEDDSDGDGDDNDDDEFNNEDDCCSTCSYSTFDSTMTSSTIVSGDRVTLRRDVYSCSNMDHRVREFHEGNEIKDLVAAQEIVSACSVLVGMHPDQAAEPLVDFALQNRKPFVLIPCCVYHKQFPHRRLPNGDYVKRYGELIEYLLNKSPEIHALQMDFEGKNIMLYYLGDRSPLSDPNQALSHVCKGPATPDMWWELSSSIKKTKAKKGGSMSREAREVKARQHRETNSEDHRAKSVAKKAAPTNFDMADDFHLSFFEEEIDEEGQ